MSEGVSTVSNYHVAIHEKRYMWCYSETTKSSLAVSFSDLPLESQDSICYLFVVSYGPLGSNSSNFLNISLDQSNLHADLLRLLPKEPVA